MPYYYFVSEVLDEEEELPYNNYTYKKPVPCDLIFPSIHCSRDENRLINDINTEKAVNDLQFSCKDAISWPSVTYCNMEDSVEYSTHKHTLTTSDRSSVIRNNSDLGLTTKYPQMSPEFPMLGKYKPRPLSHDVVEPQVMDSARDLFFDQMRQQLVYQELPSITNPSGIKRIPTYYELYHAWTKLPKSEKMRYISQVNAVCAGNQLPTNTIETQRAISFLYTSCPDSFAWPSFQYSCNQEVIRHPSTNNLPRCYQQQSYKPLPHTFHYLTPSTTSHLPLPYTFHNR